MGAAVIAPVGQFFARFCQCGCGVVLGLALRLRLSER
jgi:hypothetical protein